MLNIIYNTMKNVSGFLLFYQGQFTRNKVTDNIIVATGGVEPYPP